MSKSDNPYRSPNDTSSDHAASQRRGPSYFGAVLTVAGCVIVFAIGGVVVGTGLGALMPSYYRSVFARGDQPDFSPVAVGFGLGLTQGAFLGALVGLGVVVIIAWTYRRRA